MRSKRVLLISEFPVERGAPTGALASDLETFLDNQENVSVRFLKSTGTYVPGGLRPTRIWNLIYLHFIILFIVPYEFIKSKFSQNELCVLATTSPPFIHWTSTFIARIYNLPIIVWFQDAHPEIEARVLEERSWPKLAGILRWMDKKISSHYTGFVTLDEAMRLSFMQRTQYSGRTAVIPPWSTYLEPAKSLRQLSSIKHKTRFIYAGNYGKVHDLVPLARALQSIEDNLKNGMCLSFVGMNSQSQESLKGIFETSGVTIEFKPRFETVHQLIQEFENYDFGIVSLANNRAGVACPSKALTYLSQGLPILYVGPENTLSWQLCNEGWGILLSDLMSGSGVDWREKIGNRCGKVFPNTKIESQSAFFQFVKNLK